MVKTIQPRGGYVAAIIRPKIIKKNKLQKIRLSSAPIITL